MLGKTAYKEGEASYLLEYEKKKMKECAGTLQNLAAAFSIEEREAETEENRQNILWHKRLKESRTLVSDHLKEMADMIRKASEEKIQIIRLGDRKEKQMARMFFLEGLILEDFYLIEKENGRRQAVANIYQSSTYKKSKVYSAEEVAAFLSVLLNMHFIPASQSPFFVMDKPQNMYFEEEAKYMVLTGFAKAVKENEKISGDNYAFFEAGEREFVSLLSDGMGSGEKACEESETVIEMAERFLEAGFSRELTVQMVNDALIAGREGKNMSTLDVCSINLHTGKTEFVKAGAAYSLLKRDSYVEKIPSISLPLGVFHEMEMSCYSKTLLDGDYILLFSDGVTDCFHNEEGEEFLKELVGEIPYRRPSEMANYLMKHVIQSGNGHIHDDMTILVIGIWENAGRD